MPKLYIIGTGPGHPALLTEQAKKTIAHCDILLGAPRLLKDYSQSKHEQISCKLSEIKTIIEQQDEEAKIGILASGDVGFYSIAKQVTRQLGKLYPIEQISGISSMQYFCARLKESYDEIYAMSLHGRSENLIGQVRTHHKVFTLTGGEQSVSAICEKLVQEGLGEVNIHVGENLSYPEECMTYGTAQELMHQKFESLAVMLIENVEAVQELCYVPGIPDEAFKRGKVPMTKQEVRVVSLAKLGIASQDIIYDIGAGTGSVAIEMAHCARAGKVYAIERKSEAIELIQANKEQFKVTNLEVVESYFPEGIENLPTPDKVFIGGSGGNLGEIIQKLLALNPVVKIVVNAITLETLSQTVEAAKRHDLTLEITQLYASNSKQVGGYHMMMGQNPIFILTMGGKKDGQ